ncbi:MAG: NAD-binding protein [Candidatus Sericytochromatia bacterium]
MSIKVALLGFSNVAYRTALRLHEAEAEVLFFAHENDSYALSSLPDTVQQRLLPYLHPQNLPLELQSCDAVIIASEDEQFNLHATLQLHSDCPEMRIVARCFNLDLGREIETRLPHVRVLSVSDRAAPFFAATAFSDGVLAAWKDERGLNARLETPEGVATRTLLATDFHKAQPIPERQRRSRLKTKAKPDTLLMAVLLGLFAVIALGSLFFWLRHGLPLGDALYFVVTTLTTTGYGDYSLKDFPFTSKLVGMGLMLSGASLFAILFALLTDKLFQLRLESLLGQGRVNLSGHIIVCGAGDVGLRVIENLLCTGAEVVVLEKNPEGRFNQYLRAAGLPLLIGDARLPETLERAGITRAQTILCASTQDMVNLEMALNARQLNPHLRIVVRVYDRDFAEQMHRYFGLDVVLSSSAIAAQAFADAALN